MGTISFPHRHEFQAHATPGIYMPTTASVLIVTPEPEIQPVSLLSAKARVFSKLAEFRTFKWRVNNPRTS
jgi:hypothetical protein